MKQLFFFTTSLIIVAFGQPAWIGWLGLVAAVGGYALFWKGMVLCRRKKHRFYLASLWFCCVQLIQLSWMTSIEFVGAGPLVAYLAFSALMGIQFGTTSLLFDEAKPIKTVITIPALWTLFELSRLLLMSGFTFNPAGMAFVGGIYPLQVASFVGVYGLSFLVMATNIATFFALQSPQKASQWAYFAALALFPYYIGWNYLDTAAATHGEISALLVQTALSPAEKDGLGNREQFIPPYEQWTRIVSYLATSEKRSADFIVLPEHTVPLGTRAAAYDRRSVIAAFQFFFDGDITEKLPPLESPWAYDSEKTQLVSNAFWAQTIANIFNAHVIIGLEEVEEDNVYASAVILTPDNGSIRRYDKKILLPFGEYIPFSFLSSLAKRFGIDGSFSRGIKSGVFSHNAISYAVSICYEETFGNMIRKECRGDVDLLVNITNDVWYPHSRLPIQHLHHARLRTVENGIPLIRACNTGVTAVVDCDGVVSHSFGDGIYGEEWRRGILAATVPLNKKNTFYSQHGDITIIATSLLLIAIGILYNKS